MGWGKGEGGGKVPLIFFFSASSHVSPFDTVARGYWGNSLVGTWTVIGGLHRRAEVWCRHRVWAPHGTPHRTPPGLEHGRWCPSGVVNRRGQGAGDGWACLSRRGALLAFNNLVLHSQHVVLAEQQHEDARQEPPAAHHAPRDMHPVPLVVHPRLRSAVNVVPEARRHGQPDILGHHDDPRPCGRWACREDSLAGQLKCNGEAGLGKEPEEGGADEEERVVLPKACAAGQPDDSLHETTADDVDGDQHFAVPRALPQEPRDEGGPDHPRENGHHPGEPHRLVVVAERLQQLVQDDGHRVALPEPQSEAGGEEPVLRVPQVADFRLDVGGLLSGCGGSIAGVSLRALANDDAGVDSHHDPDDRRDVVELDDVVGVLVGDEGGEDKPRANAEGVPQCSDGRRKDALLRPEPVQRDKPEELRDDRPPDSREALPDNKKGEGPVRLSRRTHNRSSSRHDRCHTNTVRKTVFLDERCCRPHHRSVQPAHA
eukprot:Sspe_Gene.23503::Locus_9123_Transcript_1_1_Confidence_1.000_Length_2174::g.23503::m.23503